MKLYPCPGEAHENGGDACPVCSPDSWGLVPVDKILSPETIWVLEALECMGPTRCADMPVDVYRAVDELRHLGLADLTNKDRKVFAVLTPEGIEVARRVKK